MGRGQNDLGVKADSLLNFRRQMPQHRPGGLDGLEDAARQTQLFDQCIVQSLLSAPTSAVVLAFVYSLAGTPQSR